MHAKEERKQREELEATLKLLEKNRSTEENQCLYDKCKRQFTTNVNDSVFTTVSLRQM